MNDAHRNTARSARAPKVPLVACYSVSQLMTLFGVKRPTVWALIRERGLRAFKVGSQWRVSKEAVQDFVRSNSDYLARANAAK